MKTSRPFSGPRSVGLAGLTLVTISVASFTQGFLRQARLPAAVESPAKVVLMPRKEPAPVVMAALEARPVEPAPATTPAPAKPRRVRAAEPAPEPTLPTAALSPEALAPSPDTAIDAAATGPAEPAAVAPPQPASASDEPPT